VSDRFTITVNGAAVLVSAGTSVAAALLQVNALSRHSERGEPRQPLCGMGICYECRAQIDGKIHQKTCQVLCSPGIRVVTE